MKEEHYKSIINNSEDFITLIGKDYVYEIVNDTYCEGIDKNKDELLGARVEDVWGSEKFYGTIKGYLDRCFSGEHVHYIDEFKFGPFMKYMHVSYYPFRENNEITHAIVFSHDITHIGRLESKLNHYEYRDPLTGLFNRRSLDVILDKELERAGRSQNERLRVLLFIDLHDFEKVIELYGQEIGDLLLENTGQKICNQLRNSDYIFRFEGNRFAVLLAGVENELDAGKVAEKIYDTVTFPYAYRDNDILVGCSIGAALYPFDGESKEDLIRKATAATHEAKRRERNFLLFDEKMHREAVKRLELESLAYRAIEERQFDLFFQPIVNDDYKIIGAEALLRWAHPKLGNISPMEIIPLAERSGLILAIGKWVLFNVSKRLAEWGEKYDIYLSYNMSAREFASPDLETVVGKALENGSSVDPKRLKVEITETTCVRDIEESIAKMKSLKSLGVDLYIDDFGTGHSSLTYLKKFPADLLKIDRAFVDGIEHDESERIFLSHIIQMIHSRDKKVLVEGVDSAEQARLIRGMGCSRMQGFYFSKPVEAETFERLLELNRPLPVPAS